MGLFRKHGKWYIDYYYHGRRVREAAGTSKRKANAALTARKGEILQGRFRLAAAKPSPQFEVVLKQYEAWAEVNTRSWRFTKNSRVPPLKAFFKGKTLRSITPWLIEKYKAERRGDVQPATVNRELAFLSHLFTKAIEWGHASEHPMKGGKVRKVPGELMRERVLMTGEEVRLLAKASEDLRPFLVLALDTGMRFGEILGLVWGTVDLLRGQILISQTKNGRPRRLPLTERARKILEELRARRPPTSPTDPVFSRRDGQPVRSVREAFIGARDRAKLPGLRFHDLRHTFATRLVSCGVDIITVQHLLGHRTLAMTQRYAHPTSPNILQAIRALESVRHDGHRLDTVDSEADSEVNVSA